MTNGEKIPVAVIGASGYSGAELLRLLLFHEHVEIVCLTSRQAAGKRLVDEQNRFRHVAAAESLRFVEPSMETILSSPARVAFLALPHGVAYQFAEPLLAAGWRVIDLSDDFRVLDPEAYAAFRGVAHPAPQLLPQAVYGLTEIHGDAVATASLVACPGCYPTSILLPLLPLVRERCVDPHSIRVASMSGVSGAGRKESIPLLFSECNESLRAYNAPKHRHLAEMEQELSAAAGAKVVMSFTPHLVPITAGMASTIYADIAGDCSSERVTEVLANAYQNVPFVRLLGHGQFPDTKNVKGSNYIDIGWVFDERTRRLVIFSAIDNLGKGAASQAIQNFNRMHGLAETSGLDRV